MMPPIILPPDGSPKKRRPTWPLTVVGVLVMVVGLGLLVWPFIAATWLLAVFVGSALIVNGLALIVRRRANQASIAGGLLLVVIGVLAMVFSEFTAGALVTFAGVGLIFIGVLWLVIALALSRGSFAPALPPVLVLLAGVAAIAWPEVAVTVIAVFMGVAMLVIGVTLIWGANKMRGFMIRQSRL